MESLRLQIKEIFELEKVDDSDVLRDYELWDSLSVISLLAFVDSEWNLAIQAEDLAEINTVGELWQFIEANAAGQAK